jgi:3-oxoacyl-[acyl-carrier-protein] synthase II
MTDAGLTPADVVHVNAHATGTPLGDVLESEAIGEAIGQHPVLTAPKSCLGHLIGGAGAVEAIITVLTIREGLVPATRNLLDQADEVKHEVVTGEPYRMKVPAALSNSFGFGGHNAVLAFTEL